MSKVVHKKHAALVLSFLMVLAVVVVTPRFLDLIFALGHYIPQQDLATDYVKAAFWALALGLGILFWPVPDADKRCLLLAWLAKTALTLGLMLFYENNYGLDAYMYFEESNQKSFSFRQLLTIAGDSGTENVINIASLNNLLLPHSYHAQKVTFSMIGLVGIYLFYRSAVLFLKREDRRIFFLLAFFPGILFWSSILGKEPIVFFAISLYVYGTVSWVLHGRYRSFLAMAAGICIGMIIRSWLGPIMIVPLVLLFFRSAKSTGARVVLVLASCAVFALSAGPMLQRFKIEAFEDLFTAADRTTQGFVTTAGGSTQQLKVDLTSPAGALKFLPQAGFTALFRPLPGEVRNPFGLLAGIESSILLVLLLLAIKRARLRELAEPLVLWALSFIVIWALVNGIVSSANFGVAVRYKLQILPVLLGLLSYLARRRGGGADQRGVAAPVVRQAAKGDR